MSCKYLLELCGPADAALRESQAFAKIFDDPTSINEDEIASHVFGY